MRQHCLNAMEVAVVLMEEDGYRVHLTEAFTR
jgi:hypothetical protein